MVGRSNTGKSTLLNSLVGSKIAITTPKPQTTRHTIHGVIHDPRGQIVFVDTPGIFTQVPDHLTGVLNEKARNAVQGIDALLYVVDPTRHVGQEEQAVHRLVSQSNVPKILVLNKSDQKRPYLDEYMDWKDEFAAIVDVSALQQKNLGTLVDAVLAQLPYGELLYPEGQMTNVENNFWLAELIREKVFMTMHEEIPYSTTVTVEEVADRPDGTTYIKATIVTNAERYKKMLIGARGRTVKLIGTTVRKELELVLGKKIFIDLDVDIDERWQEKFE